VARPACHGVGLGQDYLKPGMRGHAAGMSLLGHAEGCCIPSCGWLSRPCPRRSSPCSSGAQTAPARWCLGDQRRWAGGRLDVKFNARAAGSLGCGAFAVSQRSVREHSGVLTALSARTPCALCVWGGGGGGGGGGGRATPHPRPRAGPAAAAQGQTQSRRPGRCREAPPARAPALAPECAERARLRGRRRRRRSPPGRRRRSCRRASRRPSARARPPARPSWCRSQRRPGRSTRCGGPGRRCVIPNPTRPGDGRWGGHSAARSAGPAADLRCSPPRAGQVCAPTRARGQGGVAVRACGGVGARLRPVWVSPRHGGAVWACTARFPLHICACAVGLLRPWR